MGGSIPTRYNYTGQYSHTAEFGLYFYNARWYDPTLGRFTQPDSLIPEQSQGTQAWDRYAYVNNNPLRYNDPTGHCPWCIAVGVGALVGAGIGYGIQVYHNYQNGLSGAAAWTQNISAEPIINGAFIGAGAVIGAYVVTQAAVALLPAATTAGTLACADSDCTNEVTAAVNAVNNPVPDRLARVFDAELLGKTTTLGAPGTEDVFVTAADDIAGITSSQELARTLTLMDNEGNLIPGPFAVLEFDTPNVGVASPVFRNNPGFVGTGRTAGGAREFVTRLLQHLDS